MARNLYLIRHGRVDFPDGIQRCIGRTDLGLDETGKKQARALAEYFKEHPLECIFSSPLSRAAETAELLGASRYPLVIKENLTELDMGEWENLPLKEIKKDLETEPAHGEKRRDGCRRFSACIEEILSSTKGDVAVVAHAGINCAYLSQLLKTPIEVSRALPQPYCGFSRIVIRGEEKAVAELGRMAAAVPSYEVCEAIWAHYRTPEPVRAHCLAVCELAAEYGKRLSAAGNPVDLELLRSAALLHDVVRQKKDHPLEGAKVVIREGYPRLAPLLLRHHDWERTFSACRKQSDEIGGGRENGGDYGDPLLNGFFRTEAAGGPEFSEPVWSLEAAILYLADKELAGTDRVTVEERFSKSRKRCLESENPEAALAAHEKRYKEAKRLEEEIQKRLGGTAG